MAHVWTDERIAIGEERLDFTARDPVLAALRPIASIPLKSVDTDAHLLSNV